MKRKITILMFGLLLAVGWTNSAQAQNKELRVMKKEATASVQIKAQGKPIVLNQQQPMVLKNNAPRRTNNFDSIASATRTKADFEAMGRISWTDLQGTPQSTLLTEPYTDANGIIALLKRIYTDKNIPGAKYSAPRMCDLPYQTIEHGWDIIGTIYNDDVIIYVNSSQVYINTITIKNGNGDTLRYMTPWNGTVSLPSSWTTDNSGNYWHSTSSSGGQLAIPAEWLQNDYGYAEVIVAAAPSSSSYNGVQIALGNDTYDYAVKSLTYTYGRVSLVDYIFPGTITPPDDNGYTICLVKLNDGINTDSTNMAPEYTQTTEQLRNYLTTYIKEVQLLTDGMRVGEGGDNPGTVFAYTGKLNRFFFIGKGKMFYYSSIDGLDYDRAPFFSMFEEFSANTDDDSIGFNDFYIRMMQRESYPILHDCMGVNYRQHYFSMSGKAGTTENDVSSLLFFIPDYRGIEGSDYRNYDQNHQPEMGMYIIELQAVAEQNTSQVHKYDVTVTWDSNLDHITDNTVPQTYELYEIKWNDETGKMDTTKIYTGPNTSFTYPVDQNPSSYDITYYVIGTPDNATNKDVFYDKSSDKSVTIPGYDEFLLLDRLGYESDYIVTQEKNDYRNYLSPRNQSNVGGICPNTIGSGIRTLELWRIDVNGETCVAYLDIIMDGNKPYYRIRYENENNNNNNSND